MNTAIDQILTVDRLAFEDRAYINSSRESPGGRGINASTVIHSFGGETMAVATSGGEAGKRFVKYLEGCGFPVCVVPIRREIRTDLTIIDRQGLTVNLNQPGPELTKTEISRFERAVRGLLDRARWLLLCGSIPPGVPASFYGTLVTLARRKKVRTLLRASGDALVEGLQAKPTIVTVNQHVAERLLDRTLLTSGQFLEAAQDMRAMGPGAAVLSLGSRGAVGAFEDGLIEAVPPSIQAICPIGAGDALNAAYTWARERDATPVEALRWGVAAGTASSRLPGMCFASLAQTREIYDQVEIRRAD